MKTLTTQKTIDELKTISELKKKLDGERKSNPFLIAELQITLTFIDFLFSGKALDLNRYHDTLEEYGFKSLYPRIKSIKIEKEKS